MSGADPRQEARRWLRYAHQDLGTAELLLGQPSVAPRQACWLAQQAAEKGLKAALVFLQIEYPKRHDLDVLRNLLPAGWQVKEEHPQLGALTEWAVEARYPGDWSEATETEAQTAVTQARAVWERVCADLAERGLGVEVGGGPAT